MSRGFEIWKYLAPYICFQTPPPSTPLSPGWLQIFALLRLLNALGGDEGVGMGGYLISLLLLLLIYDDYPSKS